MASAWGTRTEVRWKGENGEQEVMAVAYKLAAWQSLGELTTFSEEMNDDPYLTDDKAETACQKGTVDRDMNIAAIYFREMNRFPLLTKEKEIELARQIQHGERTVRFLLLACSAALGEGDRADRQLAQERTNPQEAARTREEIISEVVGKLEKPGQHSGNGRKRLRDLLAELKTTEAEVKAAKTEMVQSNLRLVVRIAKIYINKGLPFLDLLQEGNLGLMKAVGKYDYRRGFKFSTYASWWIRQTITRALADKSRTVRIPNHLLEIKRKTSKAFHQLLKELGRAPQHEEIAARTRIPLANIQKVMELIQEPVSLETPVGDDGSKLEDLIGSEENLTVHDDLLEDMDRAKTTRDLLSLLSSREEKILRLRFGIGEPSGYTLEQIGNHFGISRERVRQIEQKALQKLKGQPRAVANCGAQWGAVE